MRTRILLVLMLWAGCDSVSLNVIIPPPDLDPSSDGEDGGVDDSVGDDPTRGEPGAESILLCVVNESGVPITFRVSVVGLTPVADGAGVGERVCFEAPCGAPVGIDQIESEVFSNSGGAQFLGESIPCGQILILRIQPDGRVDAFLNNPAERGG